jgi:nucleoid-associated protein EbfC
MKDIMGFMKQAQAMQERMQELQADLERVEVEGVSGGGLVRVTLTGKGEMKSIALDPSLFNPNEREIMEDLVVTAHADARRKSEALVEDKMKALSAGLSLPPGLKLPF